VSNLSSVTIRLGPIHFKAGYHKRQLNLALFLCLLGRLRVDLIKPVSNVRPSEHKMLTTDF